MAGLSKKHLRVIREIQNRIPKELLMSLTKKEIQAPTIKKVIEEALRRPDTAVSPRQKRRLQAVLDSGTLDREVEVLDHSVEAQIDAFIQAEVDLAVKLGRLPKEAPQLEALKKKGKKYAKKQEQRLRREFEGKNNDVADDSENNPEDESQHQARSSDGGLLLEPGAAAREQGT